MARHLKEVANGRQKATDPSRIEVAGQNINQKGSIPSQNIWKFLRRSLKSASNPERGIEVEKIKF